MNLKVLKGPAVAFAMALPIAAFAQGASAPGGMSGEVSIEARFRRLDTNGDGYITWEEARPQRAAEFKRLDRNGDGFLTEGEFEDRAVPLAAFDADHDGKVSTEEYLRSTNRCSWRQIRTGTAAFSSGSSRVSRNSCAIPRAEPADQRWPAAGET